LPRSYKRGHPEFSHDNPEQIAYSVDMTGLRDKIGLSFQVVIARTRWCQQSIPSLAISEDGEIDPGDYHFLK
jgi:hypothetical protein